MSGKILLRDSLRDTGTTVTSMSYSSPDIITHSQVSDPKTFFTDNYGKDPNEALGTLNKSLIYVRVKNVGNEAISKTYINLYSNQLSLYLNPLNWGKNRISTIRGNNYSTIDSLACNEIGVTDDYFSFEWKNSRNGCFVAAAGSEQNPDFTWINSWARYVDWVTTNANVAARNMVTYKEDENRNYENEMNLCNPYETDATFLLVVEANSQVPEGTKFGIESGAFGIDHYIICSKTDRKFSISVTLPPKADNYVIFYGVLADKSASWPVGASLTVQSILVQFGMDAVCDNAVVQSINKDGIFRNAKYMLTPTECTHIYNSNPSVRIQAAPANNSLKAAAGPVFGLIIGECGVQYIKED